MIDSDNVLLLRPIKPFEHRPSSRLLMTITSPAVPIDEHPIATFETEHAENTFPALPVRTGESVVVCFSPETENPRQFPADRRLLEPTPKSHLR